MSENSSTVSVIIPTHNRSKSLLRTLDSLRVQTYPLEQFEVVVVADGCTDRTIEMLRNYDAPFALRILEKRNNGPSAARNHGAANSSGRLLLFLDDDVEPTAHLIEAHVQRHRQLIDQVVIGPYIPVFQERDDFIYVARRAWWENKFYSMRQVGHRYSYQDLVGGNLSLKKDLFNRVGGFDSSFPVYVHEDYELGMRLINAGARFTFCSEALAYHHETVDLDRSLQRARLEGRADVHIGRRHPELRPVLPLAPTNMSILSVDRLMMALAFRRQKIGNEFINCLRPILYLLERARLRRRWSILFKGLLSLSYWLGAAEELGTLQELENFLDGEPAHFDDEGDTQLEIDVREGIEVAERRLDEERPASARIHYGHQPVGRIPSQPGSERLRGVHLRPILATELAIPLLKEMALESASTMRSDAGLLYKSSQAHS